MAEFVRDKLPTPPTALASPPALTLEDQVILLQHTVTHGFQHVDGQLKELMDLFQAST